MTSFTISPISNRKKLSACCAPKIIKHLADMSSWFSTWPVIYIPLAWQEILRKILPFPLVHLLTKHKIEFGSAYRRVKFTYYIVSSLFGLYGSPGDRYPVDKNCKNTCQKSGFSNAFTCSHTKKNLWWTLFCEVITSPVG